MREISPLEAIMPKMLSSVANRAIHSCGSMGTGADVPLAEMRTAGRALRIADGPDEAHRRTIARLEIAASRERYRSLS